jgi:hypothetical protein
MESEIKILEPSLFQSNPKAKLVCHPEDNGHNLEQLSSPNIATNFLDVSLQRGSDCARGIHSRTINVTAKQSLHEVPFYQREYWMREVKPAVEFLANNSQLDPTDPWRIVDVCDSSLIVRELLTAKGFTTFLTHTFRAVDRDHVDHIVNGDVTDRVTINNPDVLGRILKLTKEYYLRHQFYRPGIDTIITLAEIKTEKVFFATVRSGEGPRECFIIKFDHPSMIERERDRYEEIKKVLKHYKESSLVSCIYHLEKGKRTDFKDTDLLDIVISRAIAPELAPPTLTLKTQWPKSRTNVELFYKKLEPVFDLLQALAVSHRCTRFKKTTARQFYAAFFRRLYGFTATKEYDGLQRLLPLLFAEQASTDINRTITKYAVRRVRLHGDNGGQETQLSIQLEPITGERALITFKQLSRESSWVRTLAQSQLLNKAELMLDTRMFTEETNVWSRALEKIRRKLESFSVNWTNHLTERELPFSSQRLPNPIRFFHQLQNDRQTVLKAKRFHWISSLIHFDLHLDNILAPVSVRGRALKKTPTLIDVASMEEGPIEYDYARLEVRLVLDGKDEKWLDQELVTETESIIKFHDAIKQRGFAQCPIDHKAEVDFIKRLRRKRARVIYQIQEERKHLKGVVYEEVEDTMNVCLVFEYLSEFFQRSSSSDTRLDVLWALVSAAYYLKDLEEPRT